LDQSRFITLNWDTVVERGIRRVLPKANFDYGSGAEPEDFNGNDIVQVKLGKEKVTRSKDSWFSQLVILRQLPLLVLVSSRKIEEYLRSDTW